MSLSALGFCFRFLCFRTKLCEAEASRSRRQTATQHSKVGNAVKTHSTVLSSTTTRQYNIIVYNNCFIREDFTLGKPHLLIRSKTWSIFQEELKSKKPIGRQKRPNLKKYHYQLNYFNPKIENKIEFDEFDFENFTTPKKYDRSDMSRGRKVADDDMKGYFKGRLPYDTEFSFEDDFEEVDDKPRMWGSRKGRHNSKHLDHLEHGTWGESVVDKTISKYFLQTENEKINKTKKHIKNLSENIAQERLSLKFIEKHPDSKMIGKLKNGNLVFESKNIKYKITPKGDII